MAKYNQFGEIGATGLKQWGGHIQDDFLQELRGKQGYKRYDEMRRNSAVVGAILSAIELMVRGCEWQVTSDQGQEDERVVLVNDAFDAMSRSMNDHISETLSMLPFGYAPFEVVYKRDGSRVLWQKFAMRGQDTLDHWEFDDSGGLAAFWQEGSAKTQYRPVRIPIEKMLLYRTKVERNNPEGVSMLRTAWISYYYLKNLQQIEAIGAERDLAGLPVLKLPPGADTTDSTTSDLGKAKKMVRNVRVDEQAGIVLPPDWEFNLISSAGGKSFNIGDVIQRYESRILMAALAQFLILGQNGVGTQALSADMSELFDLAVNSIADVIAEVLTKYAVPRLLVLNGYDPDGVSVTHTPAGSVDLIKLGQFFQSAGDKFTWTPQDEIWLRGLANMPEIDEATIEEERQRKAEAAVALFQQRQAPPQRQDDDGDDDTPNAEQMGAELYAADNAPDDAKRRAYERQLYRLEAEYLGGLQKKLLKSARKSR